MKDLKVAHLGGGGAKGTESLTSILLIYQVFYFIKHEGNEIFPFTRFKLLKLELRSSIHKNAIDIETLKRTYLTKNICIWKY